MRDEDDRGGGGVVRGDMGGCCRTLTYVYARMRYALSNSSKRAVTGWKESIGFRRVFTLVSALALLWKWARARRIGTYSIDMVSFRASNRRSAWLRSSFTLLHGLGGGSPPFGEDRVFSAGLLNPSKEAAQMTLNKITSKWRRVGICSALPPTPLSPSAPGGGKGWVGRVLRGSEPVL